MHYILGLSWRFRRHNAKQTLGSFARICFIITLLHLMSMSVHLVSMPCAGPTPPRKCCVCSLCYVWSHTVCWRGWPKGTIRLSSSIHCTQVSQCQFHSLHPFAQLHNAFKTQIWSPPCLPLTPINVLALHLEQSSTFRHGFLGSPVLSLPHLILFPSVPNTLVILLLFKQPKLFLTSVPFSTLPYHYLLGVCISRMLQPGARNQTESLQCIMWASYHTVSKSLKMKSKIRPIWSIPKQEM